MTSRPEQSEVCDTTRLRHLGLLAARTDRAELLFGHGGLIVPRVVADPTDPYGTDLLDCDTEDLSELAAAEQRFIRKHRRFTEPEDWERATALANVRRHPDLAVVDLSEDEQDDAEAFMNRWTGADPAQRVILGPGECAVLAVAENRGWVAGLDEAAARGIADQLQVPTRTTQDVLRELVAEGLVTAADAELINDQLIAGGFRGGQPLYIAT